MNKLKHTPGLWAEEYRGTIGHVKSISDKLQESEYNIKELLHYKNSTVGLWTTDRPDLIPENIKEMFFQLK